MRGLKAQQGRALTDHSPDHPNGAETEPGTLRNYIDGEWVEASGDGELEDRDPSTGRLLSIVPLSESHDVDQAVAAARAAQPKWRRLGAPERARSLLRLRDVVAAHREELAALVTEDMGKTTPDAVGELGRGIESIESAMAVPHLMKGETLEGVTDFVDVELVRQPVGVVAAITPFNFPAMIPLWFLPYAVATGNTFILKPSEQDPLPSDGLFELIEEEGIFPSGVVNLVHGGRDTVNSLLDHPDVDAISFVGSAETARHVYQRAAATGKRVQAMGGAKNALVVLPDAQPAIMVKGVIGSAFGAAGQRCLAGSLLVLVGNQQEQDASLGEIVAAAGRLRTGPGDDPDSDVCPLISPAARERIEGEIEAALDQGAKLVLDGRSDGGPGGSELGPTIIDQVERDARVVRQEVFGPLLTAVRVADLQEAIEFVNSSRYGNASAIFTAAGASARAYRYGVQAGMIGVNVGVPAPVAWFPFAGWKDSMGGDLHANGMDAIDFYTRKKVVTSRWS